MESWLPVQVKGLEDYYEVSNMGQVRSLDRTHKIKTFEGKILKQISLSGYLAVSLKLHSYKKLHYVHRLVAKAFVIGEKANLEVNHIDGNKNNNRASNLEWVTRSENIKHAFRTGLKFSPHGVNHFHSKFIDKDILYIRNNPDNLKARGLSKKFDVSKSCIHKIIKGKAWRHIPLATF